MQAFRRLAMIPGRWTLLCCVMVLAMRMLVPAGYMPLIEAGRFAVMACPDASPDGSTVLPLAKPAMDHGARDHPSPSHKGEPPCAFAALSAPVLGGADRVLLVAALALVAASALTSLPVRIVRAALYLRPPLRGPPARD